MADDKAFQPGDVVGLKSGGPGMTVRDTWTDTEGRPGSTCQWFTAGEELREAGFGNGMLEKRQAATVADLVHMESSGARNSPKTFAGYVVSEEWAKDAKTVATRLGMPRFVAKVMAVSDDRFEAVTTDGRFRFTDVRPSRHVAGLGTVIGGVAVGDEVEITTDDGETYYLSRSIRQRMVNPKTGEVLMAGVGGIQPEEPATQMSTILAARAAPFGPGDVKPLHEAAAEAKTPDELENVRLVARGSGLPFAEAVTSLATGDRIILHVVTGADGSTTEMRPDELAAYKASGRTDARNFLRELDKSKGRPWAEDEQGPADAPDSLTYFNSVMGFQGDR